MNMKYVIWNKKDNIITPNGKVFTPEQWIEQHPVAGIDGISIVCSKGVINGAFFAPLEQMISVYEKRGADFSKCTTDEEKLVVIETFDEEQKKAQAELASINASNEELTATSLASIAASLEYQNMLTLEDTEEV